MPPQTRHRARRQHQAQEREQEVAERRNNRNHNIIHNNDNNSAAILKLLTALLVLVVSIALTRGILSSFFSSKRRDAAATAPLGPKAIGPICHAHRLLRENPQLQPLAVSSTMGRGAADGESIGGSGSGIISPLLPKVTSLFDALGLDPSSYPFSTDQPQRLATAGSPEAREAQRRISEAFRAATEPLWEVLGWNSIEEIWKSQKRREDSRQQQQKGGKGEVDKNRGNTRGGGGEDDDRERERQPQGEWTMFPFYRAPPWYEFPDTQDESDAHLSMKEEGLLRRRAEGLAVAANALFDPNALLLYLQEGGAGNTVKTAAAAKRRERQRAEQWTRKCRAHGRPV